MNRMYAVMGDVALGKYTVKVMESQSAQDALLVLAWCTGSGTFDVGTVRMVTYIDDEELTGDGA